MLTPFQRLLYCSWPAYNSDNVLLAASGPTILVFNAARGNLISRWSHATPLNANDFSKEIKREREYEPDAVGPPDKKRKLSQDGDVSEAPSAEIVVENNSGKSKRPRNVPILVPSIICMCGTSNNKHIIVVTGEDKAIHVLEVLDNGTLKQLSRRVMPKRPSSIVLTPDQKTILCGDKFGDVYALPLLLKSLEQHQNARESFESGGNPNESLDVPSIPTVSKTVSRPYKPAANSLTVHSKKNLRALKSQQELIDRPVEKKVIEFEHQLLLGHVSLLTDLLCVTVRKDNISRNYILSSDRDEHIRVSRGMPQAHIIEGYCLGHHQFVNKMCIPSWKPEILVSGGGDDYILVWNWETGATMQEVEIRSSFQASASKVAVSGIWAFSLNGIDGHVIIACEAVPELLAYYMDSDGMLKHQETLIVEGNVLNVIFLEKERAMFYSIDNVHEGLTTDTPRPEFAKTFLGSFHISDETNMWIKDTDRKCIAAINQFAAEEEDPLISGLDPKSLSSILYGVEHLRKRVEILEDSE